MGLGSFAQPFVCRRPSISACPLRGVAQSLVGYLSQKIGAHRVATMGTAVGDEACRRALRALHGAEEDSGCKGGNPLARRAYLAWDMREQELALDRVGKRARLRRRLGHSDGSPERVRSAAG